MGRPLNFWQCNPSNCGTSSIWNTQYTYDLAGDVTQWVHPDKTYPATFTNTVNNAQQITNVATQWTDGYHPSSLATISYSPWGAINSLTNGCAGSGCTNTVETYTYNNRLQPWMIQLGTSTNSSSDYCLVYNYFSFWTAPSSCPAASSVPTSGTGNNGNATGYWYQDLVNTSFDQTMTYTYDNVNRLTEAVATGNSSFTQTYGYTGDGSTGQYGNMTCKTGCANMPANLTLSASTNHVTSSNYTYDAAGNMTYDASASHAYQWDAEGRVSKVDSGTTWTFTYDAVGDRVAWVSGGVTSDHLFDPAGNWLGVAGSYSIPMLGIRPLVVYNSGATWFHHVNNIDSRTFMTGESGSPTQDMVFYPWGNVWLNWGGGGLEFADLAYDDPNSSSQLATYRLFSGNLGRWHSPDPLGGDITNPQTLNRYAYVLNNTTNLTDPTGLQNPCANGPSSTCTPEQNAQSNLGGMMGGLYTGGIADMDEFVALEANGWRLEYEGTINIPQPAGPEGTISLPFDSTAWDVWLAVSEPPVNGPLNIGVLQQMAARANGIIVRINAPPKLDQCWDQAIMKNAPSLGVDVIGFIIPEGHAAAEIGLGVASTAYSVATGDTTGSALGVAGTGVSVLGPIAKRAGWGVATLLPGVGQAINGLGTIRDLKSFNTDFQSCLAGQ